MSSFWNKKRDYLTFGEIMDKFEQNKYSEKEISEDYIKLCKILTGRGSNPSTVMYKFLHENLPTAKRNYDERITWSLFRLFFVAIS
jgi:hypothetical protein